MGREKRCSKCFREVAAYLITVASIVLRPIVSRPYAWTKQPGRTGQQFNPRRKACALLLEGHENWVHSIVSGATVSGL
jgi:hypothetical protein